ncbi:MAG: hypothetical protein DMG50_17495 [Acidobacteria bacterium]|nr:MAG: hypothetical protein DMG50_17495 [Acidobacteriota bacterium]
MRKYVRASIVFAVSVICALAGQKPPGSEKDGTVTLRWLGTAGWEISDGTTWTTSTISALKKLLKE